MSHIPLKAGDRVQFELTDRKGTTRKFKGRIADTMNFKERGEELKVPVERPRNTKRCLADFGDRKPKPLKVRWLDRSKVRKLPD